MPRPTPPGPRRLPFQTHQWNLHGLAIACQAAIALARGQAEDAARSASAAIQSYHRSDYFFYAAAVGYPTLIGALSYLGERERGRRVVTEWREIVGPIAARYEMLFERLAGTATGPASCRASIRWCRCRQPPPYSA